MPKIIKSTVISDAPIVRIGNPEKPALDDKQSMLDGVAMPETPTANIAEQQQQAEELILKAQEEAAACLTEAQQQAQELALQAQEQGFQLGYQEGYTQGQQAAFDEMKSRLEQAAAKAQNIILLAEQQARETVIGAERQIIDLTMAIARKILVREVEENPMVILPIVKAALEKIRDQEQIKIRVNPEDYDLLLQARRDLQMLVGRDQALQIVADQTVTPGGCIIDSIYGSVDARLDTQLDTLRKALEEALP